MKSSEATSSSCVDTPAAGSIVVGYALTSKKEKSFLKQTLIVSARNKGIQFVPISPTSPLSEQGPFNIILHKLQGKDWSQSIKDYQILHPEVTVVDPPDSIQHLSNRQSMLEVVDDLKLPHTYGKIFTPRQLVISKYPTSIPDEVTKAGLNVPLVVKPLVVDGSEKSHELYLAYDHISLSELEAPMVLQEFINHNGVLFKVFIVGESIKVVRRFSLPDVIGSALSRNTGVFSFPRVSCAEFSADEVDLDPAVAGAMIEKLMMMMYHIKGEKQLHLFTLYARKLVRPESCTLLSIPFDATKMITAELPPQPLLEMLAKGLHHRLGLRLFNVDIIRQKGSKDLYYIIDINYFPGYGKMPEYESIFTDFLLKLAQSKCKK